MKVSLLQIDVFFGDPEQNYQHVREVFNQADLEANQLVILPELWNTGYDLSRLADIADTKGQRSQSFLRDLAQKYQIYLIAGSIAQESGERFFNTTYVYDPKGVQLGEYDKVHLFRLMREEQFLSAGNQPLVTPIGDFQIACDICYDLRFPEWFRKQASLQANVFVVVAQWPQQRLAAWQKLLQARAIENQAYVLGVNRVGQDPDNVFAGHSLVVDPEGNIIIEMGSEEGIATADISAEKIAESRQEIPVFADRRPELYV
ncbi:carbon-nitrogen family hydrolase [Tetragenococcus halophilus]|uniref:Carbon-nitrogen family hydrolase n=1 Tax=Tetragenococcus halophilus TaxID=51669 RepID=A0A3G5FK53_TETHA|nr:carbon-nitrogen family hydrolase [Tetragenococcus halophilus]AYW50710.1 carbon-nitrogen family hydrolase [Tetragenococcus halophilus]MCF1684360.1 carbon-nitrogen family hydrolase [Tetragenococcus halophilus]GBD64969.1 hypothetical protein TEHD23766T_2396 [Tetragenococcus halophilus subsp. flandriensis]